MRVACINCLAAGGRHLQAVLYMFATNRRWLDQSVISIPDPTAAPHMRRTPLLPFTPQTLLIHPARQHLQVMGMTSTPIPSPPPAATVLVPETFTRRWSNATQWPGQALPAKGAQVSIPAEWTVLLDKDPPALGNLSIQGTLLFTPARCILHLSGIRLHELKVPNSINRTCTITQATATH